jgi:hypothetical protein
MRPRTTSLQGLQNQHLLFAKVAVEYPLVVEKLPSSTIVVFGILIRVCIFYNQLVLFK